MRIDEILHAYDQGTAEFQPLRTGDQVRVFHGFSELKDAVAASQHGLTGRTKAARRYSYENDNNPYGLFVTLDFKTASKFASAYEDQVVIEFVAQEADLEPPVWPGGGYTVQGELSQYFGHGREGRVNRRAAGRRAEDDTAALAAERPDMRHIAQSDRKYLARLLTASTEMQALFVGDLPPEGIAAFHVRPKGSPWDAPFERLDRETFLARYADPETKPDIRVFGPADAFDPERFKDGLGRLYGKMNLDIDAILGRSGGIMRTHAHPVKFFMDRFGKFLWPRQYRDALRWFWRTYSRTGA